MGMFDYIRCHAPLPLPEFQANEFQTKDMPALFLDHYEIRADGSLWHEIYNTEDQSELAKWRSANPGEEPPDDLLANPLNAFLGCMTRVNKLWVPVDNFTGSIRMYNTIGKHSTGWIEFSADIHRSVMRSVQLVSHKPIDPSAEEKRGAELTAFFEQFRK